MKYLFLIFVSSATVCCAYLAWVADFIEWLRFGALGVLLVMLISCGMSFVVTAYRYVFKIITITSAFLVICGAFILFKQPVWGSAGFLAGAIKNGLRVSHLGQKNSKVAMLRTFLSIDLKERLNLLCGYKTPYKMLVGEHVVNFSGYIETKHEFSEIFLRGDYGIEYQAKAPVIIDCGAHIGLSILFFKMRYPDAMITAFEPDPTNFKMLKCNIRHACIGVKLENKALFDKDGELWFEADRQSMSKLSKVMVANKTIKVPTVRLSTYIDGPVDIVKMDIEGAESEVIKEVAQAGKLSYIKNLIMKFHYAKEDLNELGDILNLLAKNNFNVEIRENMRLGALFVPQRFSMPLTLLIHAFQK